MPLITDFILAYTSGRTIDGRQFPDEWVKTMSERYNLKTFTANVNHEHSRYMNMGTVVEVKYETVNVPNVGERQGLFVRIEPNDNFLWFTKDKNRKYWLSIRINPKFPYADGAGPYLEHVAITTNPAAIGVEQLDFSAEDGEVYITEPMETMLDFSKSDNQQQPQDNQQPPDDDETAFLKKFFQFFKSNKTDLSSQAEEPQPEDEDMNEEQFGKFMGMIEKKFEDLSSSVVGSIDTAFSKVKTQGGSNQEKPAGDEQPGGSDDGQDGDTNFSSKDIATKLEDIKKRLPSEDQLSALGELSKIQKQIGNLEAAAGKAIGGDAADVTTNFSQLSDDDDGEYEDY